MYPLFESIKVENGTVMNLEYHQERIARSSGLRLDSYIKTITLPASGIYKLRITYKREQFSKFTLDSYIPKRIKTLKPIFDNTIEYSVKSENRLSLERLFELRGDCDDIMIIKNNKVTDTSFCNILLHDGSRWFTPASPLLKGTCRARLIKENKITPMDITLGDLEKFQKFMLINALLDLDESRAEELSF